MIINDFRLLVGLGNPGEKYNQTRHNIGFTALKKLAEKESVGFHQYKKIHGELAEIKIETRVVRILLPNTYMNESGRSIRAALDWFGLEIDQLLVLVDDMDLPLGKLRLRNQGSSGGHNGLKSAIEHLGTNKFSRLRIGIGAPISVAKERKTMTISHVLGKFTKTEKPIVDQVLNEVLFGLEMMQSLGFERAGNHLNAYKPEDEKEAQ